MTAGRTNHTLFAAAPAVMQALETKTSSVSNTPTITLDYMRDLVRDAGLDWSRGFDLDGNNRYAQLVSAVLALAESKSAAKVAELELRILELQAAHACADLRAHLSKQDAQEAQARIDALMLEHCPHEMTPEQLAEWAKHQVPTEEAAQPAQVAAPDREADETIITGKGLYWDLCLLAQTLEFSNDVRLVIQTAANEIERLQAQLAAAPKREGGK
jgi:hypothetical protein